MRTFQSWLVDFDPVRANGRCPPSLKQSTSFRMPMQVAIWRAACRYCQQPGNRYAKTIADKA